MTDQLLPAFITMASLYAAAMALHELREGLATTDWRSRMLSLGVFAAMAAIAIQGLVHTLGGCGS